MTTERKKKTDPIQRFKERPTFKTAIHANCQRCVGGDFDSGWRDRIRSCSIYSCEFHGFRPYKPKT